MPDVHAKLSASGSKQWINCPKSIKLSERFEEKESPFAEEGTRAHSMCEELLTKYIESGMDAALEVNNSQREKDVDMARYAKEYLEYVTDIFDTENLKNADAMLFIEERVDFSDIVPEGFGTCDCIIVSGKKLIIIDFKYGKGVQVDALENSQLRLYAYGALMKLGWMYPIEIIEAHIFQPRLHHLSLETITAVELINYSSFIKERADLAYHDQGEFKTGSWCKFCKAKAICRERAKQALNVVNRLIGEK